jgi:hypothetical protein
MHSGTGGETTSPRLMRPHLPGLVLLACLALVPPPAAVAQTAGGEPSARELREAYPLHATPEPGAGEAATPAAAPPAPSGRPREEEGSSQATLRLIVAGVLAIVAFAAGFRLAVRRPRPAADAAAPANGPPAPVAAPAVAWPPATSRGWTAETEWRVEDGEARFRVVARAEHGAATAVVAESPGLQWPPAGAAAGRALTAAAEELETRMVGAGWRPLPPGDSWYAKRYAWEPVASIAAARGRFARRGQPSRVK